jgi:hypothetical protein
VAEIASLKALGMFILVAPREAPKLNTAIVKISTHLSNAYAKRL